MGTGVQIGPQVGLAIGRTSAPLVGVVQDATRGVYLPANSTQWATVRAAAGVGNPSHLWLCQEAAGNLADSIGAKTLTLFGAASYRQTLAGWATKGVGFTANSNNSFYDAAATIGDITAHSVMLLAYLAVTATPAGTRDLLQLGATSTRLAQVTAAPVHQVIGSGGQATGTGAANPGTAARPVILQVDRTHSKIRVVTDQEYIEPAYTAPAGGTAGFQYGDSGATTAACALLYLAYFEDAAAELTRAEIKTLLQTLGWSPSWTP